MRKVHWWGRRFCITLCGRSAPKRKTVIKTKVTCKDCRRLFP